MLLYARCGPKHFSPSRVYVCMMGASHRKSQRGRDVHHRADLILRRRDGICCRGAGGNEARDGRGLNSAGSGGSAPYQMKQIGSVACSFDFTPEESSQCSL